MSAYVTKRFAVFRPWTDKLRDAVHSARRVHKEEVIALEKAETIVADTARYIVRRGVSAEETIALRSAFELAGTDESLVAWAAAEPRTVASVEPDHLAMAVDSDFTDYLFRRRNQELSVAVAAFHATRCAEDLRKRETPELAGIERMDVQAASNESKRLEDVLSNPIAWDMIICVGRPGLTIIRLDMTSLLVVAAYSDKPDRRYVVEGVAPPPPGSPRTGRGAVVAAAYRVWKAAVADAESFVTDARVARRRCAVASDAVIRAENDLRKHEDELSRLFAGRAAGRRPAARVIAAAEREYRASVDAARTHIVEKAAAEWANRSPNMTWRNPSHPWWAERRVVEVDAARDRLEVFGAVLASAREMWPEAVDAEAKLRAGVHKAREGLGRARVALAAIVAANNEAEDAEHKVRLSAIAAGQKENA